MNNNEEIDEEEIQSDEELDEEDNENIEEESEEDSEALEDIIEGTPAASAPKIVKNTLSDLMISLKGREISDSKPEYEKRKDTQEEKNDETIMYNLPSSEGSYGANSSYSTWKDYSLPLQFSDRTQPEVIRPREEIRRSQTGIMSSQPARQQEQIIRQEQGISSQYSDMERKLRERRRRI